VNSDAKQWKCTDEMVENKLNSMLAEEKIKIGSDPVYHVLANTVAMLDAAYRSVGITRPDAQVRSEALDIMLRTVSGDQEEVSDDYFRTLLAEAVKQYRPVPEDFTRKLDEAALKRREKAAKMTEEEQIQEAFDAYLGTLELDEDGWRAWNRKRAEAAVNEDYILDETAERENITVSDEECEKAVLEIAGQCGTTREAVLEAIDLERVRLRIRRDKAKQLMDF